MLADAVPFLAEAESGTVSGALISTISAITPHNRNRATVLSYAKFQDIPAEEANVIIQLISEAPVETRKALHETIAAIINGSGQDSSHTRQLIFRSVIPVSNLRKIAFLS